MSADKADLARRKVLQGFGVAVAAGAVGCGGESGAEEVTVGQPDGGSDSSKADATNDSFGADAQADSTPDVQTVETTPETEPVNQCVSSGNLSAKELLAPIDTFVVLCMENRSFDHYLGTYKFLEKRDDIDGLLGTESNPGLDGKPVQVFNLTDYTPEDPPHEWDECHGQFNGGKNDGFVIEHSKKYPKDPVTQKQVMGYHTRSQIPAFYALADGSAICQQYFCSVMGPTWPNRFYLHGGTSRGQKKNMPELIGFKSIWKQLEDAKLTGKNYYHDIAWATGAYAKFSGNYGIKTFFEDAKDGALPNFSLIDPQFFGGGANDDHPDHDIQLGQALIKSVFTALTKSPQWNRCMFILTYDEHGGFYDHVPPPKTVDTESGFEQMGFRVPSLVAGPFVRAGCAINTLFDHTSVLKTLSVRFGLAPLTARVAAANDFSSCINAALLKKPQPGPALPNMSISMQHLRMLDARGDRGNHHKEMRIMAEKKMIPRHLDQRAHGLGAAEDVLRWGERLGALRIVR